ncbi:MAG: ANTAR domain-containing protein [Lachnospiraceae bacterium]|nr:ANTAR domain-containing protein [Lachnospiraceae bacterium]
MTSIVVVFPKAEEAKGIRNLLVRNGFPVAAVCTTGAQVLGQLDGLNDGVVISGYKLTDMMYSELLECMPEGFELLLIASAHAIGEGVEKDIVTLAMPLKVYDLISTVEMMVHTLERRRKKRRLKPKVRNEEEASLILSAKELLMNRNHMSEEEAHRYIQKCSMDSGTNMVETAQMILSMMQ